MDIPRTNYVQRRIDCGDLVTEQPEWAKALAADLAAKAADEAAKRADQAAKDAGKPGKSPQPPAPQAAQN